MKCRIIYTRWVGRKLGGTSSAGRHCVITAYIILHYIIVTMGRALFIYTCTQSFDAASHAYSCYIIYSAVLSRSGVKFTTHAARIPSLPPPRIISRNSAETPCYIKTLTRTIIIRSPELPVTPTNNTYVNSEARPGSNFRMG